MGVIKVPRFFLNARVSDCEVVLACHPFPPEAELPFRKASRKGTCEACCALDEGKDPYPAVGFLLRKLEKLMREYQNPQKKPKAGVTQARIFRILGDLFDIGASWPLAQDDLRRGSRVFQINAKT
ncbi:hypothetical protein GWK47_014268 [Chionoecetes opilio]|uniref:Uncharacterized protein n=1 Tax=Chionoecetes opilio TaxID=41210 RepID=A0A8J4Y0A8_CHIOP|nr:hypothetical protein GWK47_014268 [Chionoecetes opilio]